MPNSRSRKRAAQRAAIKKQQEEETIKKQEKEALEKAIEEEPILKPNPNRFVLFPIRYQNVCYFHYFF
jgi:hypothetical protein